MRMARCITAFCSGAFCFAAICAGFHPLRAQSPEQNKPVAQLIFEGGSGEMTSQPAGSAAGVAFHFEDSLPTFGRLVINEENLGNRGVYRSGEDFIKLQGAKWAGLNWGLSAGDFRVSSNLLDPLFGNFFFPEIAARGAYIEAGNADRKYVFYAGSETLPLVPINFFRARAPQSIAGMSAQRTFLKKFRAGASLSHLSSAEHQIDLSPFAFLLPADHRFRNVTSAMFQSTYTIASHLKLYGEANYSLAERIAPLQPPSIPAPPLDPLSSSAGIAWESPRLMLKANYVYQGLSYLPLAGYFLGDRRGPYAEFRFKASKRLELVGNTSRYVNNLERDPARPLVENDSTTLGATLNLPAKLTAGVQMLRVGTEFSYGGSLPSYLGNRLFTASVVRPLKQHSVKLSMRQVSWLASRARPLTELWPEVEDTFNSKRVTAVAAIRIQRRAIWLPEAPAFRGAIDVRLARITAHADVDSANLQASSVPSSNAIHTVTFRATARLGKGWNFEIQSSRMRLTGLPNVLPAAAPAPPPQLLYEQGTILFRLIKQIKFAGRT
jgi:hypothetical protein